MDSEEDGLVDNEDDAVNVEQKFYDESHTDLPDLINENSRLHEQFTKIEPTIESMQEDMNNMGGQGEVPEEMQNDLLKLRTSLAAINAERDQVKQELASKNLQINELQRALQGDHPLNSLKGLNPDLVRQGFQKLYTTLKALDAERSHFEQRCDQLTQQVDRMEKKVQTCRLRWKNNQVRFGELTKHAEGESIEDMMIKLFHAIDICSETEPVE